MNITDEIGFQTIADATNPTAIAGGVPIILYGMNLVGGGLGSVVSVYRDATGSVEVMELLAPALVATTLLLPGVVFPTGCSINTGQAQRLTVFYQKA